MKLTQRSQNDRQQKQFYKILSPDITKNYKLPTLNQYQTILQTLNNKKFLYVDFQKVQADSLTFMQKTQIPEQKINQNHESDNHESQLNDIQVLGKQCILDMNNLSTSSYKMVRYVSERKNLMIKKRKINQIESIFMKDLNQTMKNCVQNDVLKFGPQYRKREERNKKFNFSYKIQPEKLQEYLQTSQYRKIQKKLQKSEKQLQNYFVSIQELRKRQKMRNIDELKPDVKKINKLKSNIYLSSSLDLINHSIKNISGLSNQIEKNSRMNVIKKRSSLSKSSGAYFLQTNNRLNLKFRLPIIKKLGDAIQKSYFSQR